MVQKLVFGPLIDYANLKASKTKTLDSWMSKVDRTDVVIERPKIVKEDYIIKKNKQMTLDKFFG